MYWNNYQLAYTGGFSSLGNHVKPSVNYTIEIYKKYLQGQPPVLQSLTFTKDPCILSYLDDEMAPGIKGCEATINILNIDNQLPLSTFYSDSDDEWKVQIWGNGKKEFEGYLIQDVCEEIQTDIAHEITLRFTDGLGLLKQIPFNQGWKLTPQNATSARVRFITLTAITDSTPFSNVYPSMNTDTACFVLFNAAGLNPQKFDTLYIRVTDSNINNTTVNGIYTINRVDTIPGPGNKFRVYVDEPINSIVFPAVNAEVCCITPNDINIKSQILNVLKACLYNTGILLETYYSSSLLLKDSVGETDDIFSSVLLEPNSFSNNGEYKSCYDVLNELMTRFNFTIFQGFHQWIMFRYYERRFKPSFDGYKYTTDFTQRLPTTDIEGTLSMGDTTDIEYGLLSTILRPQSYIIDEYPFTQRDKLIINSDLLETDGAKGNFKYYPDPFPVVYRAWESKYWRRPNGSRPANAYITDIYVNMDALIKYQRFTRYIQVDKISNLSDVDIYYLMSEPIDINFGDEISISFAFSTDVYFDGGTMANRIPVILTNGTTTWYLSNSLGPDDNIEGFSTDINEMYLWNVQTITNEFSVSMSATSPSDGKLRIFLPRGIDQTLSVPAGFGVNPYIGYKDFQITITPFVVGNATAKNQFNKTTANLGVRNNMKIESYLSDSAKNFTQGCLLTNYISSEGISIRSSEWRENNSSSLYTLQRVMTAQKMAYYYKNRQKLEGRYLSATAEYTDFISTSDRILNPAFFILFPTLYPDNTFVFGKMDINLKECNVNFTAYELFSEADPGDPTDNIDEVFNNLFTYTYETR